MIDIMNLPIKQKYGRLEIRQIWKNVFIAGLPGVLLRREDPAPAYRLDPDIQPELWGS